MLLAFSANQPDTSHLQQLEGCMDALRRLQLWNCMCKFLVMAGQVAGYFDHQGAQSMQVSKHSLAHTQYDGSVSAHTLCLHCLCLKLCT